MNPQMARSFEPERFERRAMPARPIDVTSEDEQEFQDAIERYRQSSGRPFPTWSEVLEVLRSLGYAKRIWKPVGVWAPLASHADQNDPTSAECWYATVETPVTP